MKKDTLINLYWILDAIQKNTVPNPKHVGECFISIRDELLQPDTEEIVVHIHEAWQRPVAAADTLADEVIGRSRSKALSEQQLAEMMSTLAITHRLPAETAVKLAVDLGRLVEAAHGIKT